MTYSTYSKSPGVGSPAQHGRAKARRHHRAVGAIWGHQGCKDLSQGLWVMGVLVSTGARDNRLIVRDCSDCSLRAVDETFRSFVYHSTLRSSYCNSREGRRKIETAFCLVPGSQLDRGRSLDFGPFARTLEPFSPGPITGVADTGTVSRPPITQ